jgi:excisionase family DNA binding protein
MLVSSWFDTWSSTGPSTASRANTSKRWHTAGMSTPPSPAPGSSAPRFLTLADVAEVLATSVAQVRALVQAGELRYIQIGGRQQYRIEAVELERYIERMYAEAEAKAEGHQHTQH